MTEDPKSEPQAEDAMRHREITLADGRYMIFYTFGEDAEPVPTEQETLENV